MGIRFDGGQEYQGRKWILYCPRVPARLTAEDVATLAGFQVHDVPVLVGEGFLQPLGGGPRNSIKYFAATTILKLCADEKWLSRATKALANRRHKGVRANKESAGIPPSTGSTP
jgi:hypothetical protein